jgi:hypothetical protein
MTGPSSTSKSTEVYPSGQEQSYDEGCCTHRLRYRLSTDAFSLWPPLIPLAHPIQIAAVWASSRAERSEEGFEIAGEMQVEGICER